MLGVESKKNKYSKNVCNFYSPPPKTSIITGCTPLCSCDKAMSSLGLFENENYMEISNEYKNTKVEISAPRVTLNTWKCLQWFADICGTKNQSMHLLRPSNTSAQTEIKSYPTMPRQTNPLCSLNQFVRRPLLEHTHIHTRERSMVMISLSHLITSLSETPARLRQPRVIMCNHTNVTFEW